LNNEDWSRDEQEEEESQLIGLAVVEAASSN